MAEEPKKSFWSDIGRYITPATLSAAGGLVVALLGLATAIVTVNVAKTLRKEIEKK